MMRMERILKKNKGTREKRKTLGSQRDVLSPLWGRQAPVPCGEAKDWVRTRQTVKNVMGRKAEAAKREGQSLDPFSIVILRFNSIFGDQQVRGRLGPRP